MPRLDGDDRIIGTQGSIFIGDINISEEDPNPFQNLPTPTGIDIPITLWSARVTKALADRTTSRNYHPGTKLVYPAHAPTAVNIEVAIEGMFRKTIVPPVLMKA